MIKAIRVFLLVLIIIGVGLMVTQKIWVPKLVEQILKNESVETSIPKSTNKISYTNSSADLIVVDLPFPGAVTGKDFSIMGKARGVWYFEATFPITILNKDNKVLIETFAKAQSDWMTNDFVSFKADIKVPISYIGEATIILKKDNPSDLPEHDASISFPITIEY